MAWPYDLIDAVASEWLILPEEKIALQRLT
jgi:hypothetical protein